MTADSHASASVQSEEGGHFEVAAQAVPTEATLEWEEKAKMEAKITEMEALGDNTRVDCEYLNEANAALQRQLSAALKKMRDVPKFLEDYGDVFLSLSYFRQCLDA